MPPRSDEEIVVAIQAGDQEGLGVLVARWEQPLFRFAYRILERAEDARDVCQETFLRILSKAERFRDDARFSTWMYQIALNLCRDQLRRRKRWQWVEIDSANEGGGRTRSDRRVDVAADPGEEASRAERRRSVARALRRLPAEQREVLVLKEYEGLKFREIAEILGCPESTVKSRMYYGLATLKEALGREGIRSL